MGEKSESDLRPTGPRYLLATAVSAKGGKKFLIRFASRAIASGVSGHEVRKQEKRARTYSTLMRARPLNFFRKFARD